MASLLLIHGSWHGAWCWDRVLPPLRDAGHEVLAIDLPAHGRDTTPPWAATLGGYARVVVEAARGMDRKPLVVGHSMGGAAITAAAVLDASAFSGLVYLAAFVPLAGDSVAALGARDTASLVPASVAPALGGLRVRPSRARALFYAECSEEDAAWATAQLRVDPLRPLFNRVRGDVASSLARAYVECTRDRAVSIGRQRAMLERAGIRQVFSMQTDHSPFLSAPEALAAHLDEFASGV